MSENENVVRSNPAFEIVEVDEERG
ncbi:hypothetical protein LCGC14_2787500, partial [marine sediment metagenome]